MIYDIPNDSVTPSYRHTLPHRSNVSIELIITPKGHAFTQNKYRYNDSVYVNIYSKDRTENDRFTKEWRRHQTASGGKSIT